MTGKRWRLFQGATKEQSEGKTARYPQDTPPKNFSQIYSIRVDQNAGQDTRRRTVEKSVYGLAVQCKNGHQEGKNDGLNVDGHVHR